MITGTSGFGFFGPKKAVSKRMCLFSKKGLLKPLFIVFWGRAFWAKLSKK